MKRHNYSIVCSAIMLCTHSALISFDIFAQNQLLSKSKINTSTTHTILYKAYGGGLSCGFMNNTLDKEKQLQSFTFLISKNLKAKFQLPTFSKNFIDKSEYSTPLQTSFQLSRPVSSNAAIDNYSYPNFSKNMRSVHSESNRKNPNVNGNESVFNWLKNEPLPDFFTFEVGFDDLVQDVINNGSGIGGLTLETIDQTDEVLLLQHLSKNGAKGVVATVPNILKLPYFQQINKSADIQLTNNIFKRSSTSTDNVPVDWQNDIILPTAKLNFNSTLVLEDEFIISSDQYDNEVLQYSPNDFNEFKIKRSAKRFNLAIVDLYTIYDSILKGEYTTHDGIKIDPQWPNGNFFSEDGIFPNSIGQRVIANEFIKAANDHYKLAIPLIPTLP